MPIITFKDGAKVFVQDNKPETIRKAELDYLANQRKNTVPFEEIANGIQRGIIGIAEGLTTLPTTAYDYFNDTDVTKTVIEHFEKAKQHHYLMSNETLSQRWSVRLTDQL